ncbi:hypothetical protein [Cardinium endosymbiont of Nabis limbatus]|uniref:hypothetical protein n=1 Tax=Cardinium endosymbiont of Nabis limbatus TaxID=3066217 RepID=UPI003AF376DE
MDAAVGSKKKEDTQTQLPTIKTRLLKAIDHETGKGGIKEGVINTAYELDGDENSIDKNKNININPPNTKDNQDKKDHPPKQLPKMLQTDLGDRNAINKQLAPGKNGDLKSSTDNGLDGLDKSKQRLHRDSPTAPNPFNRHTNDHNGQGNITLRSNEQLDNLNPSSKPLENTKEYNTEPTQNISPRLQELQRKINKIIAKKDECTMLCKKKAEQKQLLKDINTFCNENNVNDETFVKIFQDNSEKEQEAYIKITFKTADDYIEKLESLIQRKQKGQRTKQKRRK